MFADRTDAGRRLVDLLVERGVEADLVLAIPRGGLPVARPVADALGVPLDVVAARKIGAPHNPELAIGAVGSEGGVWLNDRLVAEFGVDDAYLDAEIERERATAQEKLRRYRGTRSPPELDGKSVLLVDDGVATGATTIACIRQAREAGARRVILAVPVAPPETVDRLSQEADEVIVVETPAAFGAVGQFYREFGQVSDDEAVTYLDSS